MEFAGIKGCKANEVIQYIYERELSDKECEKLKVFMESMFDITTQVYNFDIKFYRLDGEAVHRINGVKCDINKELLKILYKYLKLFIDDEHLDVLSIQFDKNILKVYSLNHV